ncbi:hypothetical protein NQ156_07300 [Microbacterium sp. zg.Y625]|uniref:hypothetical protein n=1 Tax=Microbacterium jiangjiandongii TaxID=3049071 RepID=UPI00214BCB25|nr:MULTISPECIES: hypothetical protein [unclassified Microbacterium]MCR2792865.1 hypothetical protein [Microbacterium sp. zg.Y625]MCR2814500.1 hypothetical protein [Microbacterium sp. zg.Y843]WIM26837.1 hypothetical protein QNO14_07325 [Microbacterium sp. zg-Y625]
MSTPEQPTPPLTRKQMRELRNTAATPIITSNEPPAEPPVVATPLPRPATPAEVPPAPEPDASVDLDAHPLTRRQARQQERIRTASVPVITADLLAAQAAEQAERDAEAPVEPTDEQTSTDAADEHTDATPTDSDGAAPAESESAASDTDTDIESTEAEAAPREQDEDDVADERGFDAAGDERADEPEVEAAQVIDPSAERPVVNSALGADLLAGDADAIELPASFDNILARGAGGTGSLSTSNALILSQTPASGPLVGPVTATGEVLITGTFALPEGLGSKGHAPGVADGKDVDAVLVDGELPAASSPTPIAASAAVSTSKSAGEIIQPPAPEKGGRLMMALAITAGALALALVGVLVFAITTGVFS